MSAETETLPTAEEPEEDLDSSFNVNDVLFSFMSESDKLSELSRLLGRLRFAVEGADRAAADEAGEEIAALARHLPAEFQVTNLLVVAQDTSERSFAAGQALPGPLLPPIGRRDRAGCGVGGADPASEGGVDGMSCGLCRCGNRVMSATPACDWRRPVKGPQEI